MELLGTLRKRWVLTLSLLLLTLIGTAYALVKLPWTYQSQASVVLLAPPNSLKTYGNNPYMAFDSSLSVAADILRRNVMSPQVASKLTANGYTSSYLVAQAPDTSGPVLLITVTGSNPATVQHTLYGVTNEMQTTLRGIQGDIGQLNRIQETVASISPQATRVSSKKAKPLIVVFALGLVLTITIPTIVEAQRRGRSPTDQFAHRNGRPHSAGRFAYDDSKAPSYPPIGVQSIKETPRPARRE
jgi:capsular polysaccharide biosynthesis protein